MVTARLSICLSFVLCFSTVLTAQEQRGDAGPRSSPVITAAAAGQIVRFSSPAGGTQIRVQIVSSSGESLFDSALKDGNVLDWTFESPGHPIANGSYRCTVTVKDLDGQTTQKEATFTAHDGQVSIQPPAGNDGLTIVGADQSGPKITMLAHDEKNGAIVDTSGDLIFRFGRFLAGKDSEKMRLTAEGNLGIGTETPQAPLDVNGLIRTSKGIMFADGTTLTTARGQAATGAGGVNSVNPNAPGGVTGGTLGQPFASSRHLTPRPATGPAYQFVVDTAGVHIGAPIGTPSAFRLDVAGNVNLSSNLSFPATTDSVGIILLGGYTFAHAYGFGNTFLGNSAGNLFMDTAMAQFNTATGSQALQTNSAGANNTATGADSLLNNSSGHSNTATGSGAMLYNTTGYNNTAVGVNALMNSTVAFGNVAIGYNALKMDPYDGHSNTAVGTNALFNNTGAVNIAIGDSAGVNLTNGLFNIDIGSQGLAGESSTTRIGDTLQNRTFISGIRDVTTGYYDAIQVVIDSKGQLGTMSSSRRYKFDISDMSDATDRLMRLRPVTFRYLAHGANAPLQYGLVAEEVAEVYPGLVARNKDGEVETVMYQFLAPMLLNEVQKQHRQIEDQQKTIDALGQRLRALERQAYGSH